MVLVSLMVLKALKIKASKMSEFMFFSELKTKTPKVKICKK